MTSFRLGSAARERALACTPVLLMLAFAIWGSSLFAKADDERLMVRHTESVISTAAAVLTQLQSAETGQRGFLITADSSYLEPFRRSRDSVLTGIDALRVLSSDSPRQLRLLERLRPVAAHRLALLDSVIALVHKGRAVAAIDIVREGKGKFYMD